MREHLFHTLFIIGLITAIGYGIMSVLDIMKWITIAAAGLLVLDYILNNY